MITFILIYEDSKVTPLPHQGILSKFRQVRIHQRSYADALMEEQQQRKRCRVNRLTALYKMAFVWTGNNRDILNPTAGVSSSPQKASSCFKYWPHENVALKGQKASH